jgi:hypothetical protein
MNLDRSLQSFLIIVPAPLLAVDLAHLAVRIAGSARVFHRARRVRAVQTIPVERLRNTDGTLNLSAGGSGALDLRGWDVMLDSLRGPILTRRGGSEPLPKQARDPHARSGTFDPAVSLALAWQALPHKGISHNGGVHALAVIGSDLYVGGNFQATEDSAITLNNIAKFSGGAWSALPHNGLNDAVRALAVSGRDLYLGGYFSQTADLAVINLNNIAKFSGGAWSALPNHGLNMFVHALASVAAISMWAAISIKLPTAW